MSKDSHYGKEYFEWHSQFSGFAGWANVSKFKDYLKSSDTVLDFGCGSGELLKNLNCEKRIGIEPNPEAIKVAKENEIEVYPELNSLENESVDVIVSNHTLEHTDNPLQELKELYKKLKRNGKLIIVVPCESVSRSFQENDINQHLFTWSPMNLGNLINKAGYELIESKAYNHKWPPAYKAIARIGGRNLFESACKLYGFLDRRIVQVRAIARKS